MLRKKGYALLIITFISWLCLFMFGCDYLDKAKELQRWQKRADMLENRAKRIGKHLERAKAEAKKYQEHWERTKDEAKEYQEYWERAKDEAQEYQEKWAQANLENLRNLNELRLTKVEVESLRAEADKLKRELNKHKRAYADLYK